MTDTIIGKEQFLIEHNRLSPTIMGYIENNSKKL